MTGWYDPRRLLSIGIRVSEATVFGKMFDRRELIASLDPFDRTYFDNNFDFTDRPAGPQGAARRCSDENGDFWLDYAADTGDGWEPVHAVARLLARQQLTVGGDVLPQGRVLVFGGDLVYPTPSKDDYNDRLQAPYRDANRRENTATPAATFDAAACKFKDRALFAIPGNHDWYDDLTAFTQMICNKAPARAGSAESPGRVVCGRETRQTRSYFALKLPHDWWLCAFDAQLEGYIDAPQLRYFEYVAQNLMAPGSNVILCTAGPVWAYSREQKEAEGFSNFAFASLIVTGAIGYEGHDPQRQHNLRLVLTGDAHHYARYAERAPDDGPATQYITCGLAGAFLHPTHWLKDTSFQANWRPAPPVAPFVPGPQGNTTTQRTFAIQSDPNGNELLFPDSATSKCMTWWNLLFVWFNPWFGGFLAGVALFVGWLLHAASMLQGHPLIDVLNDPSLPDAICRFVTLLVVTPWPATVIVAIGCALYYFADNKHKGWRAAMGLSHAAAQVLAYCVPLFVIARILPPFLANDFWLVGLTAIAEGFVGATVMGTYLLISLNGFHRHWNEAYSSLRIAEFKGFLRLKIDARGDLTVYPIVLDKVPSRNDGDLAPRLFETPISITKHI